MEKFKDYLADDFKGISETKPLIHHITNYVVMNETANLTLCAGALPVMAHSKEEVAEMVEAAGALVLNIGTLSHDWIEAMIIAGKEANKRNIPVILDPVGVGATRLRTESAHQILQDVEVSIIRGNSAEVSILSGYESEIKGVESIKVSGDIVEFARELAQNKNCVCAVSGEEDIITDGERVALVQNGSPMLGKVTGTGCMATTMTAIFNAIQGDAWIAATEGLIVFGVVGELAEEGINGPGSFHVNIYDSLANLTIEKIQERAKYKINEISE